MAAARFRFFRTLVGGRQAAQIVGMVPPSITYSLPVIDAARSEARKATSSATSAGHPGRPIGMPPSDVINACRAVSRSVPAFAASRSSSAVAAVVSMKPGANADDANPLRTDLVREALAVVGERRLGGGIGEGRFEQRKAPLDRRDVDDDAGALRQHRGKQSAVETNGGKEVGVQGALPMFEPW
jgi:hypothetical protein